MLEKKKTLVKLSGPGTLSPLQLLRAKKTSSSKKGHLNHSLYVWTLLRPRSRNPCTTGRKGLTRALGLFFFPSGFQNPSKRAKHWPATVPLLLQLLAINLSSPFHIQDHSLKDNMLLKKYTQPLCISPHPHGITALNIT